MSDRSVSPLGPAFWHRRGYAEEPPMRDRLLELAIDELALNGTEFFRSSVVCEPLFVGRTTINHYFGNQQGLIVEAAATAYGRYVEELKVAALQASTPAARLEAWMKAQTQWYRRNSGIMALLQLPHPNYARTLRERCGQQMNRNFSYNMSVLATLIKGVEQGELLSLDFDAASAPWTQLSSDVGLMLRTSSVGLSALGASVWVAGMELPSHNTPEQYIHEASLAQHARWVTASITQ